MLLIIEHEQVPLAMFFVSGDDHTVITTVFDVHSCHLLLNLLTLMFEQYTPFVDSDGLIILRQVCLS